MVLIIQDGDWHTNEHKYLSLLKKLSTVTNGIVPLYAASNIS